MKYSFARYLRAKVSVDERALNQAVWVKMASLLPAQSEDRPMKVLEVGCGIGTMVERMVRRGLFKHVDYTGIDIQAENIAQAAHYVREWTNQAGLNLSQRGAGHYFLQREQRSLDIQFSEADLSHFLAGAGRHQHWDLLIAHAFLDLVDVPSILPALLRTVHEGVFYFTLNFDGQTILEPPVEPDLDEQIVRLYHQTMDQRRMGGVPSGDSQTGRHLFGHLRRAGATLQAAGASDWVVYPGQDGYPEDEAYFLHHILHTIQEALAGDSAIGERRLQDWSARRHAQVERHELVYMAHQIDFVGRVERA